VYIVAAAIQVAQLVDADFSVRTHVQRTVVAGCFAVLRQLRNIRRPVPLSVFHTLVVALVLTILDYSNAAARSVAGLRRSDHITETLLPVFTGCEHLSESSLNWRSLSTELFTALHLGICLICCTALLTSHQDGVSGRRPPLNWSFLRRGSYLSAISHLLLWWSRTLEHSA